MNGSLADMKGIFIFYIGHSEIWAQSLSRGDATIATIAAKL
jgi:hypothetical protein